jgi:hypothetical protein
VGARDLRPLWSFISFIFPYLVLFIWPLPCRPALPPALPSKTDGQTDRRFFYVKFPNPVFRIPFYESRFFSESRFSESRFQNPVFWIPFSESDCPGRFCRRKSLWPVPPQKTLPERCRTDARTHTMFVIIYKMPSCVHCMPKTCTKRPNYFFLQHQDVFGHH